MCKVVLFYLILGFSETSGNKEKYILGISFLFGWEVGFFVHNYCMKWEMLMMGEWWCSVAKSCTTLCNPWTAARQASLSYHQLPELAQTQVRWVCDTIQPSHILSSPSPSFSLSQHQGLFQWVGSSYQVAKVLEFQLQHQSFHEYSGLISFRIDWFDLLAVQGTLKNLLQHYSLKASVLGCSAFFMVQLSHPYMTTGKIKALIIWIFVGKVISLLFNMLCRFVKAFFPRSKHLLISWLQSPYAVILEPKKIKSVTVSIVSPSIYHEVMGQDAMILVF